MINPIQFRQLPRNTYNGLCIIFSYPSRFDMQAGKLLQGFAGIFMAKTACAGVLLNSCYIDILENILPNSSLPANTKVVLLLGYKACDSFLKDRLNLIDKDISLNAQRGSPVVKDNIIYIASYLPQDAMDMKASYEVDHNPYLNKAAQDDDSDDSDSSGEEIKTTKGKTQRGNYRFWLEKDCQKAIGLLSGRLAIQHLEEDIRIYPSSSEVIELLLHHKNSLMYFDIETESRRYMTCFGFSFDDGPTYVVPCLRYDYSPAYTDLPRILACLSIALFYNTVVGHNISGFDLFVMVHDYKLLVGPNNYDTMLAHHRLFPEVEKSLGHCISLYTTLPYHKNEGVFEPNNEIEEQALWYYNGKDVLTLKYVKKAIDKEAEKIYACESIKQINACIIPYLTMTLQGIKFSQEKRSEILSLNDRKLNAMMKIIKFLVGYEVLPSSPKQCEQYFHDAIGLPVVARSRKTQKPSLKEQALLKLYIKIEHPMIPICIYFRQLMKESGTLGFLEWKKNEIINI